MSVTLVINGNNYPYPEPLDVNWGQQATNWAVAVTNGMLQKAGGNFTLLADVNFGPTYGLVSQYYKSRSSNIASAGQIRLARSDVISFRNEANDANLDLSVNSSNELLFNGNPVTSFSSVSDTSTINLTLNAGVLSADIVALSITNALISNSAAIAYAKLSLSNSIVNADINSAAAIALSKLASVTASRALISDGSGFISVSSTTSTEIGYVSGVTSSIQTQLDSKQSSGNYITALTGDVTASGPGSVAATIANSAVTNAKMANMADSTIKGRVAGAGSGAPQDLSATQATAILNNFVGDSGSGGTKGLVPAPSAGDAAANKFLGAGGSWLTPSLSFAYRSVTSTDTATTADYTLYLSGASFTETLYTAVGNTGRVITLIHGGTSLSQIYTLATTGGQTIGGVASGSYVLYTNGESLTLQSNGTNWIILDHKTDTGWIDFPSVASGTLITAVTTAPTYGNSGSPVVNKAQWRRNSEDVRIRWDYRQTNTTSATAGSGMYFFNLPTNMSINLTKAPGNTATTLSGAFTDSMIGNFQVLYTSITAGGVHVYDATRLKCLASTNTVGGFVWGSTGYDFATNANLSYSLSASIPISGWQP